MNRDNVRTVIPLVMYIQLLDNCVHDNHLHVDKLKIHKASSTNHMCKKMELLFNMI